jgi:protocatechuate 3,4-dioxygenase alpha subunit
MPDRLTATPGQTVGPFFHYGLAFDGSNELVPPTTPGRLLLHGTVYDGGGDPVPDALVEIRQADPTGHVPAVEGSLARDGRFTGWGRAATDAAGRYAFTTLEPAPVLAGAAAFFSVVVFARGLLNRLFTRAYVPGPATEPDPLLQRLTPAERGTLIAIRDNDGLRFDIHLQGDRETVFLAFPGHGAR